MGHRYKMFRISNFRGMPHPLDNTSVARPEKAARERLPDVIFARNAVAGMAAQRCGNQEFSGANLAESFVFWSSVTAPADVPSTQQPDGLAQSEEIERFPFWNS